MSKTENQRDILIPNVSSAKLNDRILKRIEIFAASLNAVRNITQVEKQVENKFGIPIGTQHRWKTKLRRLFALPPRAPLISLVNHPRFRKAVEYVLSRKSPSDKGTMRRGKNLVVFSSRENVHAPIEKFLISTYLEEGMNATATYRKLLSECQSGRVLVLPEKNLCRIERLPSIPSVRRFLRGKVNELSQHTNSNGTLKSEDTLQDRFSLTLQSKESLIRDIHLVIDAAKRIHRTLGSKHREIVYHRALKRELDLSSVPFAHEFEFDIHYRGGFVGRDRVDFLIGAELLVEVKAKKNFLVEDTEQAKRYLKNLKKRACLLINFGGRRLQVKKFQSNSTSKLKS